MLGRVTDLAPSFLIAMPQLNDPHFERSVVLMLEHGEQGALGLVLNRPTPVTLAEVARSQDLTVRPELGPEVVFQGGPVQAERGFVLHDWTEAPEGVRLADNLMLSSSMETLKLLFTLGGVRFRLCLGYSGWGSGQLESELRDGSWLVAPFTPGHVLDTPPAQLWTTALRSLGIDPAMLQHGGGLH